MDIEQARENMIKQQIHTWNVFEQTILDLFHSIPREDFVPESQTHVAFMDMAIDLGNGQKMLAPKEEARMLQALNIQKSDNVLEIGTGTGFVTALLAGSARQVYSLDVNMECTQLAQKKLSQYNINNTTLVTADGTQSWSEQGPYDVIAITGGLYHLPKAFQDDLKVGGRLFCILGEGHAMTATLLTKVDRGQWQTETLFETVTPYLINAVEPERFTF